MSESQDLNPKNSADQDVLQASRKRTRRSFLISADGAAAAYGAYHYLDVGPEDAMQPVALEDAYKTNAAISRGLFENHVLAPTYPLSRAETLRINGIYGRKRR